MLVRKRQLKAIGCCFALVWLVANAIYLWTLLRPDEVADGPEEQPLASQPEVGTARTPSESGGALPDPPRGCPQSWHSIHAFYFDGWGTPSVDGRWIGWNDSRSPHWDAQRISQYSLEGHSPPLDLASDFYPEAGPYSSAHDGTLRRHMEHARWACIGALILPFGDSEAEGILDRVEALRRIFAAAETSGVKIGFQIQAYERRSAQSVCRDIRFLYARFGHLAAFMARPVVYVYDSYFLDDAELALCFAALRSEYTVSPQSRGSKLNPSAQLALVAVEARHHCRTNALAHAAAALHSVWPCCSQLGNVRQDYWILVGLIVNEADIDKAQRATFDGVFTCVCASCGSDVRCYALVLRGMLCVRCDSRTEQLGAACPFAPLYAKD